MILVVLLGVLLRAIVPPGSMVVWGWRRRLRSFDRAGALIGRIA